MSQARNAGWHGQQFVHRIYEESHLRMRLIQGVDPDNSESIVYTAVEVRVGDPNKVGDCRHMSQVFGVGPDQFDIATNLFKQAVRRFVTNGAIPQW